MKSRIVIRIDNFSMYNKICKISRTMIQLPTTLMVLLNMILTAVKIVIMTSSK